MTGEDVKAGDAAEAGTIALERFLPYRLSVLANQVSRAIARIYEDRWHITIAEWRLIANLARFGPMSAGEVCARSAMDKVRVSRAVAAATASGLVDRRVDEADRRRSVLTLTPRGDRIYRDIVPLALSVEQALLSGLDPAEVETLADLLDRLQVQAGRLEIGDGSVD